MLRRILAAGACAACLSSGAAGASEAGDPSSDGWEEVLDRVTAGVVSLRVTQTRDFDTEGASTSVGTGFVVDGERGILLTNRHMVHAGPVVAEAVTLDNEEVPIRALYRDPVHDFGFYAFDPDMVQFSDLAVLPLAPDAARVGMPIRVVGNDAGEKISILDGTLARLDRNAPRYGGDTYNDFNTFYLQAASNTSGGSSGSPVVDVTGSVVALNAGGRRSAASSYYLPLQRVVRALDLLQRDEPVTRGTIQAVFRYLPYDEVRRLGVRTEVEAEARDNFPDNTGMLVVAETVPEGPSWKELAPGDVLVSVDGRPIGDFVTLEAILDNAVGQVVDVVVERLGQMTPLEIRVQDLHAITPAEFVEAGRAVFNPLSYQQARNHGVPTRGVYVAVAGHMLSRAGVGSGSLLLDIDGEPITNLDELFAVLSARNHGERMRWRYTTVSEPTRTRVAVVQMDRLWFGLRRCAWDGMSGTWPCEEPDDPPAAETRTTADAFLPVVGTDSASRVLAPSLVMVDCAIPHPTGGLKDFSYIGSGLVVDADQGLVLVDRDTVPAALADIVLTFGGAVRIPGQVLALHPLHNVAVLQYDPTLVPRHLVASAELTDRDLEPGDKVWQVGVDYQYRLVSNSTRVEEVGPLLLSPSATPRFRDHNVSVVGIAESVPSLGGALADRRGRVLALWGSFVDQESGDRYFRGLPSRYLIPIVESLQLGLPPAVRTLGAELRPLTLPDARDRGLSASRSAQLAAAHPLGRFLPLQVVRRTGGSGARQDLQDGDIVLELDGEPFVDIAQLHEAVQREQVEVTVLRDAEELTVSVATLTLAAAGVDRVASFAGLVVHDPHPEIAQQNGIDPQGVYISWLWYGSPASRYGLKPTRRIVGIDGEDVADLTALLEVLEGRSDGDAVRMELEALDGTRTVKTLVLDLHYWPTTVMSASKGTWTRQVRE